MHTLLTSYGFRAKNRNRGARLLSIGKTNVGHPDSDTASSQIFSALFAKSYIYEPVAWQITIASDGFLSAGVFHPVSGVLLRTLLNAEPVTAGTHEFFWDGRNDSGVMVDARNDYVIKRVYNNLQYSWEGTIGNTSTDKTGAGKFGLLRGIQAMAISSSTAYVPFGFSESSVNQAKIPLGTDLHSKINILEPQNGDINLEITDAATDGTNVYWPGYDAFDTGKSFIFATKISDDTEQAFSSGTSSSTIYGRTYSSVFNLTPSDPSAHITGIAVQSSGNFLFASVGEQDLIKVYHKGTGAAITTIAVTNPARLAIDADGYLWMISSTGVTKHTINGDGSISAALVTLSGLVSPLSLGVTQDGSVIAVVDGGASQQLKGFLTSDGSLSWTFGQSGGYTSVSLISNDRFQFDHPVLDIDAIHRPFVAFSSDRMYLGDPGNMRVLVYDLSRNHIDTLRYNRMFYNVGAISTQPSRVFADWLEFDYDDSVTFGPRNGSWTATRNWSGGLTSEYIMPFSLDTRLFRTFMHHQASGRTYTVINWIDADETRYPELAELVDAGTIRPTGVRFGAYQNVWFDDDGNAYTIDGDRDNSGTQVSYMFSELLSIDGSGNPVYDTETVINTLNSISASEPAYKSWTKPFVSSTGKLLYFAKFKENAGYHFGAVTSASDGFVWKVAPSTYTAYLGDYPDDGRFDIGNGVEYPGGDTYGIGRNIFWNYPGEFWKNSQTNKHHHYLDSGLLLRIFGITTPEANALDGWQSPRMAAGNVQAPAVVIGPSGDIEVFTQDESVHGGIGTWRISNVDTISETEISTPSPNYQSDATVYTFNVSSALSSESQSTASVSMLIPVNASSSIDTAQTPSASVSFTLLANVSPSADSQNSTSTQLTFNLNMSVQPGQNINPVGNADASLGLFVNATQTPSFEPSQISEISLVFGFSPIPSSVSEIQTHSESLISISADASPSPSIDVGNNYTVGLNAAFNFVSAISQDVQTTSAFTYRESSAFIKRLIIL